MKRVNVTTASGHQFEGVAEIEVKTLKLSALNQKKRWYQVVKINKLERLRQQNDSQGVINEVFEQNPDARFVVYDWDTENLLEASYVMVADRYDDERIRLERVVYTSGVFENTELNPFTNNVLTITPSWQVGK